MNGNREHPRWREYDVNRGGYFAAMDGLARVLPRRFYRMLSDAFMTVSSPFLGRSMDALVSNFRPVMPGKSDGELRKSAHRTLINYGRSTVDFMCSRRASISWLDGIMTKRKKLEKTLEDIREKGEGFILITPHLGNWELGGVLLKKIGLPLKVLALPEEDAGVDRVRRGKRAEAGIETIPVGSRGAESLFKVIEALKKGGVVALLGDRYFKKDRVEVRLFNRRALFLRTPAVLARLSGCPLVPMYMVLNGNGKYTGIIDEPVYYERGDGREEAMRAVAQKTADSFEKAIGRYPEQWYNFYDYWEVPESRISTSPNDSS